MKKFIAFIILLSCFAGYEAKAQFTFGNPVQWSGTTNSGYFITNTFYLFVPSKAPTINQVYASTNQNIMINIVGVFPGNTNFVVQTNLFVMATNFSALSTNTPGTTYPFTVLFFCQASNGPASGGFGTQWTNSILMQ
jgi:hypothetical protein